MNNWEEKGILHAFETTASTLPCARGVTCEEYQLDTPQKPKNQVTTCSTDAHVDIKVV